MDDNDKDIEIHALTTANMVLRHHLDSVNKLLSIPKSYDGIAKEVAFLISGLSERGTEIEKLNLCLVGITADIAAKDAKINQMEDLLDFANLALGGRNRLEEMLERFEDDTKGFDSNDPKQVADYLRSMACVDTKSGERTMPSNGDDEMFEAAADIIERFLSVIHEVDTLVSHQLGNLRAAAKGE